MKRLSGTSRDHWTSVFACILPGWPMPHNPVLLAHDMQLFQEGPVMTHLLSQYHIDYLYHMTAVENLCSILEHGILSHNEAYGRGLLRRDISDPDVQGIRQNKREPHGNRLIHEYACLYFSPRNPMLYVRQDWQDDIVILGVNRNLLLEPDTVFSDGNAASSQTHFYRGVKHLAHVEWDIVHAHSWSDFPDGKRIKCAEVLIHPRVNRQHIQKIFCATKEQYFTVRDLIAQRQIQLVIKPGLFFERKTHAHVH